MLSGSYPLALKAFERADFDTLCEWFGDQNSLAQWGGPNVSFPMGHDQLSKMLQEQDGESPLRWLFSGVLGNALAGHAQVAFDWQQGVARLSRIAISPELRGCKLARPFIELVLERILAQPEIERVELNVYTFNAAAIRVYQQLGFVKEGVRRQAVKVGSARWDTAIYGLLKGELSIPSC